MHVHSTILGLWGGLRAPRGGVGEPNQVQKRMCILPYQMLNHMVKRVLDFTIGRVLGALWGVPGGPSR